MAESKENIEAKLAEYVEGTLDPAGRAEIEQHLAANPEHRQLMAELTGTRTVLRRLPRQSAPTDLTDLLQGQLERAVLLDDGFDGGSSLRVRRWPQVMAIAAIVVLAVGLGLVVYVTLPPEHPSGFTIIEREVPGEVGVAAPPAQPSSPDTLKAPDAPPETGEVARRTGRISLQDAANRTESLWSPPVHPQATPPATVGASDDRQPFAGFALPMIPDRLAFGMTLPSKDVVIVVAGDDAAEGDDRVVTLFRQQNLNWERIGQPANAEKLVSVDSESRAREHQLGNHEDISRARQGIADRAAQPPREDAEQPPSISRLQEVASIDAFGSAKQADAPARAQELASAQNGYVVRGLTKQQAEQLLQSLSHEDGLRMNQVYNWFDDGDVVSNAAEPSRQVLTEALTTAADADVTDDQAAQQPPERQTAPNARQYLTTAEPPIAVGESIEIEIDQLVGPGVTPRTEQVVDEAGRVKLQMIPDPVRAEGRQVEELEQVIADYYRESNLIDNPTVRVRRGSAKVQPADDEERVDLLIVVQKRSVPPEPALDQPLPVAQPLAPAVSAPTTQDAPDDE